MKFKFYRPKQIKRETAWKIIINCMCNGGFMNGWCGDTDQDFRNEQLDGYMKYSNQETAEWLDRNWFNLTKYCKIPRWVLLAAF